MPYAMRCQTRGTHRCLEGDAINDDVDWTIYLAALWNLQCTLLSTIGVIIPERRIYSDARNFLCKYPCLRFSLCLFTKFRFGSPFTTGAFAASPIKYGTCSLFESSRLGVPEKAGVM